MNSVEAVVSVGGSDLGLSVSHQGWKASSDTLSRRISRSCSSAYHVCHTALMKTMLLICSVLVVALLGLACTPGSALDVSVGDDAISVTATLVEDGVMIENVGDVDCIVTVTSPEG